MADIQGVCFEPTLGILICKLHGSGVRPEKEATLIGSLVLRRVPTIHPATPLLHVGNASLKRKITTWVKVARPERSADVERGALLGRGMRCYQNLETHASQGGTPGLHR
jgi:hypothetical protein